MPLIDGFNLPARLVMWIQAQPAGVIIQADLDDVLDELRTMFPSRPELGSSEQLWDAIRQADWEDGELGDENHWRSFLLLDWTSVDGDSVTSGVPRTIQFICLRSSWGEAL